MVGKIDKVMPEGIPANYSNAPMKMLSSSVSSALAVFGCEQPAALKTALESGGGGIMPTVALVDDLNVFAEELRGDKSLNNATILACIGTEIVFDGYEILASVADICKSTFLEEFCDFCASKAMAAKIFGSFPLAILSADKAYAEIFNKTAFLGSEPSKDNNTSTKINTTLRAAEVGLAAISNIALYYEGAGGNIYTATSVGSNIFKGLRFVSSKTG